MSRTFSQYARTQDTSGLRSSGAGGMTRCVDRPEACQLLTINDKLIQSLPDFQAFILLASMRLACTLPDAQALLRASGLPMLRGAHDHT